MIKASGKNFSFHDSHNLEANWKKRTDLTILFMLVACRATCTVIKKYFTKTNLYKNKVMLLISMLTLKPQERFGSSGKGI